ncbi:MAG TPA: hypothetical protein VLF15_05695 [Pseudoxanthomonas sp.]|nr:hypothetical protein [Pseudoxanthomonas sp.]
MAQCVQLVNVNGVDVLSPVTAEPCTGLVVLTPSEYAHVASNPFNLSNEDGILVSAAIAGVWITAWCARALVTVLHSDGNPETD